MSKAVKKSLLAAIISCGDELITGKIVDTNSAWLSQELGQLGVSVVRHVTVPDDTAATTEAIAQCAELAGWVVLTGGLGPTPDDLTRDAVAALLGEPLELRPDSLAQVAEWFRRFNRPMAPANHVQAMAPRSASMIRNDWGTAPGLWFAWQGAECFCLPGVPHEMRNMFAAAVAPVVREKLGGEGALLVRTIHTFGIGESDLAGRLGDLLARGKNPEIGTTASAGSVSVRIYTRAATRAEAAAMLDEADRQVVDRLGPTLCFGRDAQTLESVLGDRLRAAGQKLATAESCTGGLVSQLITAVPGSSDYFVESVVTYSNASKTARLGVRPDTIQRFGAVSAQTAGEMAAGIRRTSGADWSVAITGIAGPGGGTADKPVGLVYIAVAGPGGVEVHQHNFPGEREIVRMRAARFALNWVRLAMAKA
ncbi:MAG: competence/damage-inducible protein A [Phycisphaerae bacterium]|nr:competence/damage-inducible protein A [Phycisphaerae bacterium]